MLKRNASRETQVDPDDMKKLTAAAALLEKVDAANPFQWLAMNQNTRATSKSVAQKRIEVAVETANAAEKAEVSTAILITDFVSRRKRSESLIDHHHKLLDIDLKGVDDLVDYLIGIHEDKRHRIDAWRAKKGDPAIIERNVAAIIQKTNQMMMEALKNCFGEECFQMQEEI